MKDQLLALYELQSLDVQIARINAQLASLGGAVDIKRKLEAAKEVLESSEKLQASHEAELRDSELKLKSIEEKRAGFEKRLYGGTVSNPKELSAIEKEIGILKSQQAQIDQRTLELYDLVEQARNESQSARASVAELEKQLEDTLNQESSDKARLEEELADLTYRREEESSRVTDPQLMARYDRVRNRTGATGLAKVVNGRCEGCKVAITSFTVRKLFEDVEYQSCENCGRILMLDNE